MAFLLAAGIFLWPVILHPGELPVRPGGQESDLFLSHLPNALYWRWSLAQFGQWPLWNAQILAGQPFAANPLTGLWYLPHWLVLLPGVPLPTLLNLLFLLHLAGAGYGVFRLLQAEGLPPGPALFGGLAFTGTPKLVAHLAAGHVFLVFAVAWTPWLLLAVRALVSRPGARSAAVVAGALAGMFLADVRWPVYAGLLAAGYGLALALPNWRAAGRTPAALRRWLGHTTVAAMLFLLLSAVLVIPLIELVGQSSRGRLSLEEAAIYSLPLFPYLLGLVVPLPGVIHEWVTYAGLAPLGLALVGARRRPFWLAAGVAASVFALGTHTLLFALIWRWVPGLGLLRVPARAWFIVALVICLLAAHGWQALSARWGGGRWLRRYARLGLPLLLVITGLDLLWANASLFTTRAVPAPSPSAAWLAAQPGVFRVYSSSGSLPLPDDLQHVEGVDPLHLAALSDFVAQASGIGAEAYSVSVPARFSGDPATTPPPSATLLGRLNVRYVVSEFDLAAPGLKFVQQFGATRIYENLEAQPRAWLADGGAAQLVDWSPHHLVIQTSGPGLLVVSEVTYPGWEARIDGRTVPIETVDGLLRGVPVGPGERLVEFSFRPISVWAGGLLTLLGLCVCGGIWKWSN